MRTMLLMGAEGQDSDPCGALLWLQVRVIVTPQGFGPFGSRILHFA